MKRIGFTAAALLMLFLISGWKAVPPAHGEVVVLTEVGSINLTGTSEAVAVSGNYAYMADGYSGLRIIDVTDPASPTEAGSFNTNGYAYDVAVSGNYAYVADGSKGLRIINVTNSASPTETGYYDTPGSARGVALLGDLAYVADSNGGLQIIDVGSPGSPSPEGSIATPGSAYGVAVSSLYAFVADQYGGLTIINISNPTSPVEIGNFNTSGQAYAVGLYSQYACVADYNRGLRIIDVSNPAVPVEAGCYDPTIVKYYRDIDVVGQWAFVASDASSTDGSNGLRVIDLTDPAAPTEAGYCETVGDPRGVAVYGKYAYLAAGSDGLRIIDISPLLVNYSYYIPFFSSKGYGTGVALRNSDPSESAHVYLYVRDTEGNLLNGQALPTLPPSGQYAGIVNGGPNEEGWIQVHSDRHLTGLCFAMRTDIPRFMFDQTLIPELSETLIVPHLADNEYWDTTVMVCNPNNTSVEATFTVYQTDGTALDPYRVTIPARGSGKYEVAAMTGGESIPQGSVKISASKGLAAFALYRNTDGVVKEYGFAGISAVRPGL